MIYHFEAQDVKYIDINYEDLIKFIDIQNKPRNKVRTDFRKYIDAERRIDFKNLQIELYKFKSQNSKW